MIRLSKFSQYGIACLTCLAECYTSKHFSRMSSAEIHRKLALPQPTVAKTMNTLSVAGIVDSTHGPKGGFRLARSPSEICLIQVIKLFERCDGLPCCYKGKDNSEQCLTPLRESLEKISHSIISYFEDTTLEKLVALKSQATPRTAKTEATHSE